ncbi:MAG: hypothetical protein WCO92_03330, partial [Verrucomicrobiota bacterium]
SAADAGANVATSATEKTAVTVGIAAGSEAAINTASEASTESAANAGANAATSAAAEEAETLVTSATEQTTVTASKHSAKSAADAAITAASQDSTKSAADAATSATEKTTAKSINWTETYNALGTSEGRDAFVQGFAKGAGKTIAEAPSKMATSIITIPASVAKSAASLYSLAGKVAEACMSLGSKSLTEGAEASAEGSAAGAEASASMADRAVAQLQSVGNNLLNDPIKVLHITAQLTMAALAATGSIMSFNATELKAKALDDEASVLSSQAQTTDMTSNITLSNQQIQDVLRDMNGEILAAGTTLSTMSLLSGETLGNLHGAAAN